MHQFVFSALSCSDKVHVHQMGLLGSKRVCMLQCSLQGGCAILGKPGGEGLKA